MFCVCVCVCVCVHFYLSYPSLQILPFQRRIILPSVACLAVPHCLLNGRTVGRRAVEHKMRVFIPSRTLSEIFLILVRTLRVIIINLHRPSRKVPVIFIRF
jgi:hypothetical protein